MRKNQITTKKYRLSAAACTHVGRVRQSNEDNYYLFGRYRRDINRNMQTDRKRAGANKALAAVCDGMGGEALGELASLKAVRCLKALRGEPLRERICRQLSRVNEAVCRLRIDNGRKRIGTTFVGVYFADNRAVCCNVGDSRGYLYRDGCLKQLSVDHTEAQWQIRNGVMTEEEARGSRQWHYLTQHIGLFPEELVIEPFVSEAVLPERGDVFLLCSDGLSDMLTDADMAAVISGCGRPETGVTRLVEAALQRGGRDNITAVLVYVQ